MIMIHEYPHEGRHKLITIGDDGGSSSCAKTMDEFDRPIAPFTTPADRPALPSAFVYMGEGLGWLMFM